MPTAVEYGLAHPGHAKDTVANGLTNLVVVQDGVTHASFALPGPTSGDGLAGVLVVPLLLVTVVTVVRRRVTRRSANPESAGVP